MTIATDERRQPHFGFTHRLVLAREVADLDQTELAQALDVSRGTISNYERGVTSPSRLQVEAWALACGVDLEWLKTGERSHGGPGGNSSEITFGYIPRLAPVSHLFAAA